MTRTIQDIFTNAPRSMLPAVASLLRVDEAELIAALRHGGREEQSYSAQKVAKLGTWISTHVKDDRVRAGEHTVDAAIRLLTELNAGHRMFAAAIFHELALGLPAERTPAWLNEAGRELATGCETNPIVRRALARIHGRGPARCVGETIREEDVDVDHQIAVETARATGMFAVAAVLGHDGDGDPIEYAKTHVEEANSMESDAYAFCTAMQRLGVELPDTITADAVVDAVEKMVAQRQAGYREHSIALHRIDHVLRSGTGPYPAEPWPDGADTNTALTRAEAAVEALEASVTALGTMMSGK